MQIDPVQAATTRPAGPTTSARADPSPSPGATLPAGAAAAQVRQPAAVQPAGPALQAAVESVNRYLRSVDQSLQFERDNATGKTIVRIVDTATGDLIRQIPTEEVLAIARSLSGSQGVVLRARA